MREHLAVGRARRARRRRSAASCGTSRDTGPGLRGTCPRARAAAASGVPGGSSTARCEEPESNHTSRMSFSLRQLRGAATRSACPAGNNSSGVMREPGVRALLAEPFDDVMQRLHIVKQLAALVAVENQQRHAPESLPRNAPVGPLGDHRVHALAGPTPASIALWEFPRARRAAAAAPSARERWRFPSSSCMNHCSVARKITGLWQRQQCG